MTKIKLILSLSTFLLLLAIFNLKYKKTSIKKRSMEYENKDEPQVGNLPPFSFDDLYDSQFSYYTFNPSWTSDTEYVYRDEEGIKKTNLKTNETRLIVTEDFYNSTAGDAWSLSSDEQFLLVRKEYTKQWRHSYNASYSVYDIPSLTLVWESARSDIQYLRFSPTGHGLVWVVENNLFYLPDVTEQSLTKTLEDNGGKNTIFNGVPDWVYEEEMVSSNNNIFWSRDSRFIAYVVTNDTDVERIEFSKYGNYQYPEMIEIGYPKAGTSNPTVTLKVYNTLNETDPYVVVAPTDLIGKEHLFSAFYRYDDSKAFLVHWLNRVSNHSVQQMCEYTEITDMWDCSVIKVSTEESKGWIGNGGVPFAPILLGDKSRSYFTIFSDENGYWQIAYVDVPADRKVFLTKGTSVVTSLSAYDSVNNWLYFTAAHPRPRERLLYRISTTSLSGTSPIDDVDWECMSCDEFDQARCKWVSSNFSPSRTYLVINCGGPDVPMSTLQILGENGNYGMPEVKENNDHLIANKEQVKWPTKEYGEFESVNGIKILYEMYKPIDFVETKKYPLLIEVYGGPGFQKVQDRWTKRWAQTHMVSQYDMIVVSLDGRGSGYRGDDIAFLLYQKIGQLEKEDTTEVASFFAEEQWIDETRIAVWGWSYGGYTTTFTISEGSGVFKCGMAIAPLASRYFYDTIHTERYMRLPEENPDGYYKCNILNSNLENFKQASYSIIHGTADDNVHFQNAALITKALIAAGVDFHDFFYADEAHSVNTGKHANRHIYLQLTKKVRQCFNLEAANQNETSGLTEYFSHVKKRSIRRDASPPIAPNDDLLDFKHSEEGKQ